MLQPWESIPLGFLPFPPSDQYSPARSFPPSLLPYSLPTLSAWYTVSQGPYLTIWPTPVACVVADLAPPARHAIRHSIRYPGSPRPRGIVGLPLGGPTQFVQPFTPPVIQSRRETHVCFIRNHQNRAIGGNGSLLRKYHSDW